MPITVEEIKEYLENHKQAFWLVMQKTQSVMEILEYCGSLSICEELLDFIESKESEASNE